MPIDIDRKRRLTPASDNLCAGLRHRKLKMGLWHAPSVVMEGSLKGYGTLPHFVWPYKAVLSSASLSSSSHASSSLRLFFFLWSFSFFSTYLMAFLMSFASMVLFFFTSILLPDSS